VFLLIHFGNNAESLEYVDRILSTYPNVYTDVSARVPEIGRHPAEQVRALFVKHQDRILFGSDIVIAGDGSLQLGSVWHVPNQEPGLDQAQVFYERHWRYFEANDRQMEHPTPIQGRWKVDAVGLPPEVLTKLYVSNAEKLIFSGEFPRPYAAPGAAAR
jgi:predicted TIM-barrel fold metal-dependent hydrolase